MRKARFWSSGRPRLRRHGRAMHRAIQKHQYRLWVQGGRKFSRGLGEVVFSSACYRDAIEYFRQQQLEHAKLANTQVILGIDFALQPTPLVYVHPRVQT